MLRFFRKNKVVTRIAPSPTGVMHIGTARTALFNYLLAKQNKGKFVLRIEDTDKERSKKEFEKDIIDSLNWLDLNYDEFYRQSDRGRIYKKHLKKLLESGHAYISKESGGDREEVIRFKNPNKEIVFEDLVRGEIKFDTTELGDFVIAKSLDEPLYHLAVVVDDHEMGITHVIRGEDGISNTPRQMLIQAAIGAKTPKYGHLPLILGKDKSKLSKRHGAVSISEYRKQGYLKEAIVNHLAMLGWNPGTEQEFFNLKELIGDFDLEKVSKGGAVFDTEKLDWFNKHHLQDLSDDTIFEEIGKRLEMFKPTEDVIYRLKQIIFERISKFSDIDDLVEKRELDYYFSKPSYNPRDILWKDTEKNKVIKHLKFSYDAVEKLNEYPDQSDVKKAIWEYADEEGRGEVLWPLRYSLSGKDKSPDPFLLVSILGKEESLERIDSAIKKLNEL